MRIKGINKDTEIVEAEPNCKGKQSPTFYRFDLLDPKAMFILTEILQKGAEKYGVDNWREIPTRNHINKALIHIFSWLAGNMEDDHLGHALCRVFMAVAVFCDIGRADSQPKYNNIDSEILRLYNDGYTIKAIQYLLKVTQNKIYTTIPKSQKRTGGGNWKYFRQRTAEALDMWSNGVPELEIIHKIKSVEWKKNIRTIHNKQRQKKERNETLKLLKEELK